MHLICIKFLSKHIPSIYMGISDVLKLNCFSSATGENFNLPGHSIHSVSAGRCEQCPMRSLQCLVCNVQFVFSVQCTICSGLCVVCSV